MSTPNHQPEPGRPPRRGPVQGHPQHPADYHPPTSHYQPHVPVPGEVEYLDEPVLEPRKALAPHMVRPAAPADPVPPGYEYPQAGNFPQRPPRKGTARKTEISEDLLENHESHLPARKRGAGGEHWQKSRGRRDAMIFGIVAVIVLAVVVVSLLPDQYLGIKRDPAAPASAAAPGKPRLDPAMNSKEILASQPSPSAASATRKPTNAPAKLPEEMTPEERKAVVDEMLKEAEYSRKEVEAELERLKSGTPGLEVPAGSTAPEVAPDALSPPPAAATPRRPTPSLTPTLPKSQAEIEAEVNRQIQANMQKMIQEKKLEPVKPVPPQPTGLPPSALPPPEVPTAPATPPRATPVPPRAAPATR